MFDRRDVEFDVEGGLKLRVWLLRFVLLGRPECMSRESGFLACLLRLAHGGWRSPTRSHSRTLPSLRMSARLSPRSSS
jgi:hypothetical protein